MIRNSTHGRTLMAAGAAVAAAVVLAACGGSSSSKTQTQTQNQNQNQNQNTNSTAPQNQRSKVTASPQLASATRTPRGEGVLGSIHAKRPSASHPRPHLAGFDESSVATFVHEVDGSVGTFWQSQFNAAGYKYSPATEELITQPTPPVRAACGGFTWTTNTENAAYCSADNTFYLPTGFLGILGHNFGDAAVAVAVAHENGHHVQELLGVLQRYQAGEFRTIQIELQADCLAGVWMSSEYQRGDIQPGDLQKSMALYQDLIGDPKGFSPLNPQAHGSSAQRWAAFSQGYDSGQGGKCAIPALPTHE